MFVHLTLLVLSSATLSNEIFCGSFLVQNHVICVPAIKVKCILFHNHMNKQDVGGIHNVLVHYMLVFAPDSSDVAVWYPFKWDILWFISDQKSCYLCAYHISKPNFIPQPHHRKKKVVGGKRNVLEYYKNASALNPSDVVHCNTFKWDILWFILIKNLVIYVPTTLAKQILFCNHRNKKVVRGKHNVLIHCLNVCASDPAGVILCNTFKWEILLCVHLHLSYIPKMCEQCCVWAYIVRYQ